MRPLSAAEIDEIVASLDVCVGRRLQTAVAAEQDVVLGFWDRRILWIWLDAHPARPALLPMLDPPVTPPARKTPLQLFLRAHFEGKHLKSVERLVEWGRVVVLHFDGGLEIEFRMIPRAANCIARAEGKQVSLHPVHALAPSQEPSFANPRSLRELFEEWKTARGGHKEAKSPRATLEKKLESVRRSAEKVAGEIANKENSPWRRLGDWLVQHQTLDVPDEFVPLIDQRRKLAWNIEECFTKAKEAERKLEGTRVRLKELKVSITELENRLTDGQWLEETRPRKVSKGPAPNARTLHLAENHQVVVGKSAQDNIDLLRKAHSWDLWLHIKDQPSAHAILFRPKGAKVSDEMLRKAAQFLIRTSFGAKYKSHAGEKFQILAAECRYVSPIKGDRAGRVNYRNEKTFGVKFDAT